jgi:hypothetical protein
MLYRQLKLFFNPRCAVIQQNSQHMKPDILSTIKNLILRGITEAGGSEDSFSYLTETDLLDLGKRVASRKVKKQDVPSIVVPKPICSWKKGVAFGDYTHVVETVYNLTLGRARGSKKLYFVPGLAPVDAGKEEAYVNTFGLTLCKNAPEYLLGLLATTPEKKLLKLIGDSDILAFGPTFLGSSGDECILRIIRQKGKREMSAILKHGSFHGKLKRVYLAQEAA